LTLPPGTVAGPTGLSPPSPISAPVVHRPRAPRPGRCRPRRVARPPPWPHAPTPRRHMAPLVARPPPLTVSPIKGAPSLPHPSFLSPLLLPRERAPEHSIAPSSLSSASCPPRPHRLPLLDRASSPPSPHQAAGVIDALPSHRSSAAAWNATALGCFLCLTAADCLQ
jgi:hypothetical protein